MIGSTPINFSQGSTIILKVRGKKGRKQKESVKVVHSN